MLDQGLSEFSSILFLSLRGLCGEKETVIWGNRLHTEVTLTIFQEKKIGREADSALTFKVIFNMKMTPYCKLVVK